MVKPPWDRRTAGLAPLLMLAVGLAHVGGARADDDVPPPPTGAAASPGVGAADADADRAVRAALRRGTFLWYDAEADGVKAVKLPREREPRRPNPTTTPPQAPWTWGQSLVFALFVAALVALVGLAAWTWRQYEPGAAAEAPAPRPGAGAAAEGSLPEAIRRVVATDDPRSEADRRRRAGDLAGAVTCLFAHQLLTLARLDLIRLAPGRTGRQLHRSVADPEFRALMLPTLRLFEAAYYGHRPPTPAEFDALWAAAEAFDRRAAVGAPR